MEAELRELTYGNTIEMKHVETIEYLGIGLNTKQKLITWIRYYSRK